MPHSLRRTVALLVLTAAARTSSAAGEPSPREQRPLSDVPWQFAGSDEFAGGELPEVGTAAFDQARWSDVRLPHVFQTRQHPNDVLQGWYRSRISVPPADAGRRLFLRFEGAGTVADVYVNGKHLGQHRGAYTAFVFDATDALRAGDDNALAVRVDDRPSSMTDCLPNGSRLYKVWGGLYRKVWLVAVDPVHVDLTDFASPGVYVTPTDVTAEGASIDVRTMLADDDVAAADVVVRATLLDPQGRAVQTFEKRTTLAAGGKGRVETGGRVDRPKLWSPLSPNLYHVRVEVLRGGRVVDAVTEPCGFRSLVFAGGAVTLNGKPVVLAGADLHQEIESKAAAMSEDDFRFNYAAMVDMGANWVRLPHYPHARLEYDLCDQLGLLCWAENGHSNKEAPSPNGERLTTEMVKQNYNHPSIALWSVGNEASADSADAYAPLVKSLDPTRPTFVANMASKAVDFHAANTYPGWYGKAADGFSLKASGYISETGAGGVTTVHCDYAAAKHVTNKYEPEEYQQQLAEELLQRAFRESDGKLGMFTWWAMRDFTDAKYKGKNGWNTKGLLTYAGDKKDVYYLYRCYLRPDEPTVHITSKRYFLRTGDAANGVKVYSNAKRVTLTVNGQAQPPMENGQFAHGTHKVDNVFYWPVPLRAGRNEIAAADDAGHADSAVVYYYAAAATTQPAAPQPVAPQADEPIADLRSSNPANPAYFMDMPVEPQWPIYSDLDTTADNSFDALPAAVKGARWIALRRVTKAGQATDLSFTATRAATVYVMCTQTQTSPPFATADGGFAPVDAGPLVWRDNDLILVPAALYARKVDAGQTVRLPSADRDQIVMIQP